MVDACPGLLRVRVPTATGNPPASYSVLTKAATLGAALLLAEQVADLSEQLDVGGFGWAGFLTSLSSCLDRVHRQHDDGP